MCGSSLHRILLIEHDPDIRDVAATALDAIGGFSVKALGAGEQALTAVSEFAPELILLDAMMPGMDGLATLATLCVSPEAAGIPVVLMTARARAREKTQHLELGVAGVITKPFDPMSLSDRVREIWQRWPAGDDALSRCSSTSVAFDESHIKRA